MNINYRMNTPPAFVKSLDVWKKVMDKIAFIAATEKDLIESFLKQHGFNYGEEIQLDISTSSKDKMGLFWKHHLVLEFNIDS